MTDKTNGPHRETDKHCLCDEVAQDLTQDRGALLNAVAAEVAQPLNLIAMNREFLQLHLSHSTGSFSREQVAQALAGIDCATVRLNRLVQNCLDLLACRENQKQPQFIPVDLGALLQELCADGAEIRRMCRVELQVDAPANTLLVMTDRTMAERILLNLLSNALRACAGGDTVTVTLRTGTDGGEICIADNGCGVPADFARQAFEPDVPAWYPNREQFLGGARLGLQLCGAYCRLLGWQPEMQPLLQGTRVRLHIPQGALAGDVHFVFHSAAEAARQSMQTRAAVRMELRCVPGLERLE